MDELTRVIEEVHRTAEVRVVFITGAGRAFSAGGDIDDYAIPSVEMSPREYRLNFENYVAPMLAIWEIDRQVIAAVNGLAVGGGCDLALAWDIRIASTAAGFRDAYVQLGPCQHSVVRGTCLDWWEQVAQR